MKKFTKVCLAVALITFLTGCLLGCVGAMLGGLRQMECVSVEQLTGIPFRFVRNGSNIFFGFWNRHWDDDWEAYWDWDSKEWKTAEMSEIDQPETGIQEENVLEEAFEHGKDGEEHKNSQSNAEQMVTGQDLGLTSASLRGLDLEIGACTMYIEESENDSVSLGITGECEDHYRYRIKDGNTLLLVHKDMSYDELGSIWNRSHPRGNTKIYLYLPKDAALDEISIDFGAGILEAGYLRARAIEINAGAGDCRFEGLEASESIDIAMGAGKVTTNQLIARETEMDIAAGELRVSGMDISQKAQVAVSMGNAVISGAFSGEMGIECSMGNLDITLIGAETDYNYELDCGMGEVKIGSEYCGGWDDDDEINNGSHNTLDITSAMGNVNVMFTE